MSLYLTPEMLVGCYEFLRTTQPYSKMKLPEADDVEFRVTKWRKFYGEHTLNDGQHIISVSGTSVGHVDTLVRTVAHEMIHLWQVLHGHRDIHGRSFQRVAKRVCEFHGFDPRSF